MEKTNLILIEQFCSHYNVEISFISSLQEFGLIEVVVVDNSTYIPHEQLPDIEKMIRLHYDLEINMEGIDAIANLLKQINELKKELSITQNKLSLFD